MFQALQKQMEEIRQKSIKDRHKNEEEVSILIEKNEELRCRLTGSERREQSCSNELTQNHEKTNIVQAHTQQVSKQHTEQTQIIEEEDDPKGHPFTDEIMEVQLPPKWKGLNIKLYDGFIDSDEHINIYKTQMNLYITNKVVWCKVLSASLKEVTLSWFTQLPSYSVDSFKTLSAKFSTEFATIQPHHISSLALINVRQEKGKPLRTHMERFRKLSISIRNLIPKIAMYHLILDLQPVYFMDSLIKIPTKNLDELRNWATKFMQIKELHDYQKNARTKNGRDKGKKKDRGSQHIPDRCMINSEITKTLGFILISH